SEAMKRVDGGVIEEEDEVPVVLAGFGRVGRRIGEIFTRAAIPFVALDSDAALVAHERACGSPVYYGDLGQPGVLKSVGAANARLIIVTLNDAELTRKLVAALRTQYPKVRIFARGHNIEACQALNRLGAAGVVSENVEASLELSRMAMDGFGIEAGRSAEVLDAFRKRYNEQIHNSHGDVED
ncbi:MAG: NAD-binding protein, partial [Xanthomonadales bacterium]|nr:NAD-binding protein [Xanthomonadales bacterium]